MHVCLQWADGKGVGASGGNLRVLNPSHRCRWPIPRHIPPFGDGMIADLGLMDLDGGSTTHHPEGQTNTTPKAPEVRTPNTSETSNPTVVAPRANIPGRGHGKGRRGKANRVPKEKDFLSIPNATPTGPKFWEFLESILKTHGEARFFVSQRNFSPNCFTFTYPENDDSE